MEDTHRQLDAKLMFACLLPLLMVMIPFFFFRVTSTVIQWRLGTCSFIMLPFIIQKLIPYCCVSLSVAKQIL